MRRIVVVVFLLLALPGLAEAEMYKGYETPTYTVERKIEGAELRAYPAQLVAEVTVKGSRVGAANRGFRILAGYIFGGNASSDKIAMTTPVAEVPALLSESGSPGGWTIQFGMPKGWTMDSLPKAKNDQIRFVEQPARKLLVIEFSGLAMPGSLSSRAATLRKTAEAAGLTATGPVEYQFYDPPFTLPWNRRNEVVLPVR